MTMDSAELVRRLNIIELYTEYEWADWVGDWNEKQGKEYASKPPKNLNDMSPFFAEKLGVEVEELPSNLTKKNFTKFVEDHLEALGADNASDIPILLGFTSESDRYLTLYVENPITVSDLLAVAADVWAYEGTIPMYTVSTKTKEGFLWIDMIWDSSISGDDNDDDEDGEEDGEEENGSGDDSGNDSGEE